MKKLLLIGLLFVFTFHSSGQSERFITANALDNTHLILTDTLQGTCFTYLIDNEEFIVTARHLFKTSLDNGDSTSIKIYQNEQLNDFRAKYFISKDSTIDIAVLNVKKQLHRITPYASVEKTALGQELYFLGYPYFNKTLFKSYDRNIGSFPLVKEAIYSGSYTKDYTLHFLDGHNNPGFSGGPVIVHDYSTGKNGVFGIISGYYHEIRQLQKSENVVYEEFIKENSGIIKCYPIRLVDKIVTESK
jgi:hypothetical protein